MISIIICTISNDISDALKDNIKATIGIPYELVVISNKNNEYSIFEAYNIGLVKSKFDICCFMHDDILYHSKDWGKNVIEHFKNENIGIIGIAGTILLTKIPSFWSDRQENNIINIIQSDKTEQVPTQNTFTEFAFSEITTPVVSVDGVWFCINKNVLIGFRFDNNFPGFHFYDLDACMQVLALGKEVHVVHNIIIEHFSWGAIGKDWTLNAFAFAKKWFRILPACTKSVDISIITKYEILAFRKLIKIVDFYKVYSKIFEIFILGIRVLKWEGIRLSFRYKKVYFRGIKYLLTNAN
jgi:GT2 family glycosyltransferase